ncbi:hypothetical protein SAJ_1145 [Streptococcus agalactiae 18RS21]|nr:hypothetical protein SAJ_1145 [Streptococcus agalactiae 18RS21]
MIQVKTEIHFYDFPYFPPFLTIILTKISQTF